MGLGLVEMLVLLGVGVLAILVARKSSWRTLVAVPIAMLVLLSSFTIVWSLSARQVVYSPVVVPAYETSPSGQVSETNNLNVEVYDPVSQSFHANDARSRVEMHRSHIQHVIGPRASMFGLGLLFVFGVILAVIIAARRWIAGNDKLVIPLFAVAGTITALLLVGGLLFVGGTWVRHASLQQVPATQLRPPPPPPMAVAVADSPTADPAIELSQPEATAPELPVTTVELPEWVGDTVVNDRDLRHWAPRNPAVLVSDEWSSVPESEVQLEAMATRALRQQLQLEQGPSFDWRPSKDFIHQSGAIQRRFTHQTTLKVGEFESPMYQTYWQVAATPQVSNRAQAEWRTTLTRHRLAGLGGGAASLTLLFALIAAALRIDGSTGGKYRRHMFAAAGFVTSMGAAMLMFA